MQHSFRVEKLGSDFEYGNLIANLLGFGTDPEEDDFEITVEVTLNNIDYTYYDGRGYATDGIEEGYVLDTCDSIFEVIYNSQRYYLDSILTASEKNRLLREATASWQEAMRNGYYF